MFSFESSQVQGIKQEGPHSSMAPLPGGTPVQDSQSTGTAAAMLQLLGPEQFQRVRAIMMAQQRTFVQQLYELHKLNQLQKLLSDEVLGYEQGVGLPSPPQQTPTPEPCCQPTNVGSYPPLSVAPLTGVCVGVQEEVDTSGQGWAGQQVLPQGTCLTAMPSHQHHHHHLQYHHHQHHHQHHEHHHSHQNYPHSAEQALLQQQLQQQQQQQHEEQKTDVPQSSAHIGKKSSTPQFPGPGEAGAMEGGGGMGATGMPTLAACIPGSAASAAATLGRLVLPADICHLKNIPSALRTKTGEAGSNNAPAVRVPDDTVTTNTATTPHSGPPSLELGAAPSASLPHQGNNIVNNTNINSSLGKAGVWQKPSSSWPVNAPPIPPPGATVITGEGSNRAVTLADQGLANPTHPQLSQLPVPVVGETSGGQGMSLQPQQLPPQQQRLWEQMEQQLGCESSGGAEHSVQQPEASKLNESMASWHALLFDKDQGADPNKASEHQECASAPNFGAQVDSLVALTGPKVQAFRATCSSPGLNRQPSCSTLCTNVRSSPPKAATTSPPGDGGGNARLLQGRGTAFWACSADFAGKSAQQQRLQREAPMTCANVFSTGLYAGGAAGAGAGSAAAGNNAAGNSIGGLKQGGGSGTFLRSPHSATSGAVRENVGEGVAQPAMGALRPRHSSPPTAEGGPPEPTNPATMATSGWRPSPPAAAAAALLQHQRHPVQLPSHPSQYQPSQHLNLHQQLDLHQQQQQQQQQHQMTAGVAGMGLGRGDCNRPTASAPSHLHWWLGQAPAGSDKHLAAAAAQHHVAHSKPTVSDGMHAAAAAASAAAACGLDPGLARKRSRLDGGRSSYDSAIGAQMQQQQQQQQQQLDQQDKPSAFQVVVARKPRSKRGVPTGRASRESVCSDNSLNHQAASRAAGLNDNGGIAYGGSRGSLDTIGKACIVGSRHSLGGLGGAGVSVAPSQGDGGSGEGVCVGAGGTDTNSSRPGRQQRPAPPRCLSRTGDDMEASLKGGSGGGSQAKSNGSKGKGGGGGSNKRNAATLHASPHRTAAARKSQSGKGKAGNASDGDDADAGDVLPGEGVDQSAAGILLALSSGGTC